MDVQKLSSIFSEKKLLSNCVCPNLSEKVDAVRPNTESVFAQLRNSKKNPIGTSTRDAGTSRYQARCSTLISIIASILILNDLI